MRCVAAVLAVSGWLILTTPSYAQQTDAKEETEPETIVFTAETLHVDYVKGKTLTDPTLASRSREATQRLLELEGVREGLTEELRQAGGLPGWLRRGGEWSTWYDLETSAH